MIDSLTSWRDTVARKPGCRIPRHASFTPDLQARLTEQFGPNLAEHFGMDSIAGVALKPPPDYQAPDFSSYYEGRDVPADMVISADGVGKTQAGFYHFFGFIHPLIGAETVADIEAYPLRDFVGWSDEGMAEQVANLHRAGRYVAGSVGTPTRPPGRSAATRSSSPISCSAPPWPKPCWTLWPTAIA
ncbi:MAG: hypothetical protein HN380_13630 [Victivallales bacterium]|nr:hypothetical protein [Victivallales bacterium]